MAAPRRLTTQNTQIVTHTNKDTEYDIFMKWFVMPREEKEERGLPTDIAAFLQKHNLTPADIEEFKNNPRFNDDVEKYVAKWAYTKYPTLAHRLYKKAVSTLDPQVLREFRAFGREHTEKVKAEKDGGGVSINFNLSVPDEQYRQIIAREAKILSEGGSESPA